MKGKFLVGGVFAGAAVALSSIWILIGAVLKVQEHRGPILTEEQAQAASQALGRAILTTALAFIVCAVGLSIFVRCLSMIIIQRRMAGKE